MNLYLISLYSSPDEDNPETKILCPVVIPAAGQSEAESIAQAIADRLEANEGVETEVGPVELLRLDVAGMDSRVYALENLTFKGGEE